jgi:hypothetical protein
MRDSEIFSLVFFVCPSGVFIMYAGLMTAFARQMVCDKVKLEREASSFVSHSIKQGFSSIGGTMQHLLKSYWGLLNSADLQQAILRAAM